MSDQPRDEPAPRRIDRFRLVRKLGAGGMGEVWEASDPTLGRSVALKLLHRGSAERLVREARAMARLDHPNVVTVHDAGEDAGEVWIAMELVSGGNLRGWMAQRRPWREVVRTMIAAGRGLAAAHEAGIIHRDFKPDNVLIRGDGRVVVADFGLAREGAAPASPESVVPTPIDEVETVPGGGSLESGTADPGPTPPPEKPVSGEDTTIVAGVGALTVAGSAMGTPAYMAPEQHLGQEVDARADQFAFCVTLWEALHGTRPFTEETSDSAGELSQGLGVGLAITSGRRTAPARPASIPRWLRALLDRGLSTDRAERFPSMDAVVAALESGVTRRRRVLVGATALIGAAAIAAIVLTGRGRAPAPPPCRDAEAQLTAIWDPARSEQLRAAFAATGAPYAADSFARVATALDQRRASWIAMHGETCEATAVHRSQSAVLLDRRMACLAERKAETVALVDRLATIDRAGLANAVDAIAGLPPIAACSAERVAAGRAAPPVDPAKRAAYDQLAARLAAVQARADLDPFVATRDAATAIAGEAGALPAPQLAARAYYLAGAAHDDLKDRVHAALAYEAAARAAADAGDAETETSAWIKLVGARADVRQLEQAKALLTAAETAERRAGDPPELRAELLVAKGFVDSVTGEPARALETLRAAVELGEREHLSVVQRINALHMLAEHENQLNLDEDSIVHRTQLLTLVEQEYGKDHPERAEAMLDLGSAYGQLGKLDEARTLVTEAAAALEAALGPGAAQVGKAHLDLARIETGAGKAAAAEPHFLKAIAVFEPLGLRQLEIALMDLGELYASAGDARGRPLIERALALLEKRVGTEHNEYAAAESIYATVLGCKDGEPRLVHAIAVMSQFMSPIHGRTVKARLTLGECQLERSPAAGIATLTALIDECPPEASCNVNFLAYARIDRGKAIWKRDPAAGKADLLAARAILVDRDPEAVAVEIDPWLKSHR